MTRSSGLIGCPPRLRPFASQRGPCRLPASHSRRQQALTKVGSLLELNLSLRALGAFARPLRRQPNEGGCRRLGSSLEVSSPPASKLRATAGPALSRCPPRPSTAAAFRPRRFARPRRFHPLRALSESPPTPAHGVLPFRASRVTDGHTVSGAASPLDLSSQQLPPSTGTSQTRRIAGPGLQGIYPVTRPRPPASWFPIHRGRHPLGFYFFGTSLP